MNKSQIIAAAEITQATAIHPGYGFLSEDHTFAEQVTSSGFTFIGPQLTDNKINRQQVNAIDKMKKSGIPCVPGSDGAINKLSESQIKDIANEIQYPVLIKASAGGGGRGMKVVREESDLISSYKAVKQEAKLIFGNEEVYIEKFIENPRHIEIQVLADTYGQALYIGERDCSIQSNQKVIEEATAFNLTDKERQTIGELCAKACLDINYLGAGTFEFLYKDGRFYFMEMNTESK